MCKFSRLLPIDPTAVGAGIALTLCLGVVAAPSRCHAQQPAPAKAAANSTKKGHVRFWNMLPDKPSNTLLLLANDKEPITGVAPNNISAPYMAAPTGSYTLVVKQAGEHGAVLQRLPVVVPAEGFLTLLASEKDGKFALEIFNDTPDPNAVDSLPRLVVRQFFPGAHVRVSVNGGVATQPADYGASATLEIPAPSAAVGIVLQAVLPTTPPSTKNWPLTADFSVARHVTLLLVADRYGRLNPQLSYDGYANPLSPPAAAAPSPQP